MSLGLCSGLTVKSGVGGSLWGGGVLDGRVPSEHVVPPRETQALGRPPLT